MTLAGSATAQAPQAAGWLRLLLLLAAVVELVGGLSSLPILLGNLNEVPGPGIGGAIIVATIILHPIAALAALFFLVRGKLTWTLLCLTFVVFLNWLSYLPSVALNGMELAPELVSAIVTFIILILPPIVVVGVPVLIARNKLTPAVLLAILPTVIGVLSVVAFGISVAIYGF
jgi:hypothetical protein